MKKLLLGIAFLGIAASTLADAANTLIRFTAPVTGSYTLVWENEGVRETIIESVELTAGKLVIYQIDSAKAKQSGYYKIVKDGEMVANVEAAISLGKPLKVSVITTNPEVSAEYLAEVAEKLLVLLTMVDGKPVVTTIPAEAAPGHQIIIEGSTDLTHWHPADMSSDKFFRAVIK